MKDGVRIVNVARGELIDEEALVEGLRSGKVAGAAIDVFEHEPYSGPLLGIDTVVVTPHLGASTREAQDRAGVIVAEQVAAALEGRVATNAVNVPTVPPEELEFLGPFLPLASMLGELAFELAGGSPTRLEFEYLGELASRDTRLLTVAGLNGAFRGRVEETVNFVNAPVVARERGLEVREESSPRLPRLHESHAGHGCRRGAGGDGGRHHDRGATTGRGSSRALGYEIEVDLEPNMIFIVNEDQPGRIGRVGTLLGEAGVNIATMAVSRNRPGGNALMTLTVDTPLPAELAERLRAEPGFVERHADHARQLMSGPAARSASRAGAAGRPLSCRRARGGPAPGVPWRHPDRRRRSRRHRLRARPDREVAALSLRRRPRARSRRGLTPGGSGQDRHGRRGVGSRRSRRRRSFSRITGFDVGGVAPFPQPGVREVLIDPTLLSWPEVWAGAGSDRHMAALDSRPSSCASPVPARRRSAGTRDRDRGRRYAWAVGKAAERGRLTRSVYEQELARLQVELTRMLEWVRVEQARVAVIFEGRDAAGKGGTIKRVAERLNPRFCRIVALPAPTERETSHSGTSSAMSSTCRPVARSRSSIAAGTTAPASSR